MSGPTPATANSLYPLAAGTAAPIPAKPDRQSDRPPRLTKDRTFAIAFGAVLLEARIACGLSQEAVAEAASLDRTYPSLLEHGHREPKISVFVRLCDAVRLPPAEVMKAVLARLPAGGAAPFSRTSALAQAAEKPATAIRTRRAQQGPRSRRAA